MPQHFSAGALCAPAHDQRQPTNETQNPAAPKTAVVGAANQDDGEKTAEWQLLRKMQAYLRARAAGRAPDPPLCRACRQFYLIHQPWIRRIVRTYRVPEHAVEDCVQDVWLAVVSTLESFDPDPKQGSFRGWLRGVIRHKVADLSRRMARRPKVRINQLARPVCSREPDPATAYECRRCVRIVRQTVAELEGRVPRASYQVITLRWMEDHGVPTVAAELDMSGKDVRNRTHRAKQKLRELLEVEELEHDRGNPGRASAPLASYVD